MTQVTITTTGGEQHTVACPGVDPATIDKSYIEQRTTFDVQSIDEIVAPTAVRIGQLEDATRVNGVGKGGIASRLDDLESRVEELESHH